MAGSFARCKRFFISLHLIKGDSAGVQFGKRAEFTIIARRCPEKDLSVEL